MNSNPNKTGISPDPALSFVFAAFAIITWISVIFPLTPDAMLTAGILQVSLGAAAYTGGHLNLKLGNPHGNVNLILAVILGFAAGFAHIIGVGAHLMNWTFHPWILSVILMIGGLYLLCFVPLMIHGPAYLLIAHLCVCSGFILGGLGDLLSVKMLSLISAWLLLIFAILTLYQGVSEMFEQMGHHLPQGGPLVKSKSTK